jgi:short-subunit dehydrogenase
VPSPRSVLITGASSGIGAALAEAYAAPGTYLALSGRNRDRLERTAEICRAAGAEVETEILDVTHGDAMAAWITARHRHAALDLVVANAGISGVSGAAEGGAPPAPDGPARPIFAVNVGGVVNTVVPAIPLMRARGRGQIALMSSLAAFCPMPGAPAYGAAKSAVKNWGEALRGRLGRDGIGVSVICPGFVASRMTADNPFPMPMLMDARKAARIIRRGLDRNRARIAFPFPMYAAVRLVGALPASVSAPLLRRSGDKE